MASYIFTTDTVSTGIIANMAAFREGAYVGGGVTIGSSDNHAIRGLDSQHSVIVDGRIATDGIGIYLGDAPQTDQGQKVFVRAGAEVMGFGDSAVAMSSYRSELTNAGFLYGTNAAVGFGGVSTTSNSTIRNSGKIEGGIGGVFHSGTETLVLVNSGTITGSAYCFLESGSGAVDRITNSGTMSGTLQLGSQDDFYDGRAGKVSGVIIGDSGNDTIYCGKEANTVLGDSGNDTINGGPGIDKLTGGSGNDIFIFNAKVIAANRDVINDFNIGGNDTMRLENAVFTKIGTPGVLKIAAFKLSTQVKDADDRIIYNKATGQVFYDADGSAAIAPVLFATLTNKPALTRFDFDVI